MNKVKPILFLVISFLSYCDIVIAQQIPALEWVGHIGGDSVETVYDMSVDRSGNVIICGSFKGTVDFDPSGGMFNLTSKGNKDIFIQKTDPYGDFIWAKHIGGTNDDEAYSLATDSSGNVYVTGYFKEVVLFDSSSSTILTSVNTSPDIFILKLDSFGNFKWAHQIGNYDFDEGYAITADDSAYVYITGKFSGPVDFDPGIQDTFNLIAPSSYDIFVLKLDSSGDFIWAKQMGGDGYDIGKDIAVDTLGNVHITGYFDDTADFDPGIDTFNLISHGTYDSYILKLDNLGNMIWVKHNRGSFLIWGLSLDIDDLGNIYTAGYFHDTVDFDPGPQDHILFSNAYDGYVQKLDASGNFKWAYQIGGNSNDECNAIKVDQYGFVYTTGYFYSTVDFDPGQGAMPLTSNGGKDIFISVFDTSGNFIMAYHLGGSGDDIGKAIYLDSKRNLHLAGSFENVMDADPAGSSVKISSNGFTDIFVNKVNENALTIYGQVLDNNNQPILNGKVSLLQLQANAGAEIIQVSRLDTAGYFHLSAIPGNIYLLKADLTDTLPSTLPTYYPNEFYWYESDSITLITEIMLDINILYVPVPPTPAMGSGIISGNLYEGNAYRGPSDPIDSIVIGMTRPDSSNNVYMLDTTDSLGYFEFRNLPDGNYALYPDISGIPVDTVGWTNISISGTDTETVTFLADSNMITVKDSTATGILEYIPTLKVWPNPVYDKLFVSLSEPAERVKVYDHKGSEVSVKGIRTESGLILETALLKKGIYIIEIRYSDIRRLAKFVKY